MVAVLAIYNRFPYALQHPRSPSQARVCSGVAGRPPASVQGIISVLHRNVLHHSVSKSMNRDAIIATVIGFGIGLVITGIFLLGPNIIKYMPKLSLPSISLPKPQTAASPTPTQTNATFSIDAPITESIETTNSVLVSGSSPTGSLVVVEGPTDEVVLSPNGDGKYAGKVALDEGKNEIYVTSYANGKSQRLSVIVFYTPEKF